MFESFGKNTQCKSLNLCTGLFFCTAVNHGTWNFSDFGYPPAIGFFFKLDCEVHAHIIGRI